MRELSDEIVFFNGFWLQAEVFGTGVLLRNVYFLYSI